MLLLIKGNIEILGGYSKRLSRLLLALRLTGDLTPSLPRMILKLLFFQRIIRFLIPFCKAREKKLDVDLIGLKFRFTNALNQVG